MHVQVICALTDSASDFKYSMVIKHDKQSTGPIGLMKNEDFTVCRISQDNRINSRVSILTLVGSEFDAQLGHTKNVQKGSVAFLLGSQYSGLDLGRLITQWTPYKVQCPILQTIQILVRGWFKVGVPPASWAQYH